MGRFLGTASGRTSGSAVATSGGSGGGVFTKAKVFTTPGSTTFQVPTTSTNVKVIVVGAGSSYRTNTYCHNSSNCDSGVSFPRSCYCMCFTGHLTGAGGGYAEKTFASFESVQGQTLTINVGSIGGLSASSVSGTGFTAVTASNATEAAYSWSCTNNSTARDSSNDNPVSIGFSIPVCGYQNNISGYYNRGGTASGGDINRTGGRGVVIPEFLYTSYLDGITCSGGGGSFSGITYSCWVNPTIRCACMPPGYHTTFGGSQFGGFSAVSCICYYLCACINNLCACTNTSNLSSRYTFLGRNTKCTNTVGYIGGECSLCNVTNCAKDQFVKDVPIGVGAQAGNSSDSGKCGYSEMILTDTSLQYCSIGGGSSFCVCYYYTTSGYDYSFGGTGYTCYCVDYSPGCYSNCSSFTGTTPSGYLYVCNGFSFTYYFGSTQSGAAACSCMPCGIGHCLNPSTCTNRCYNMGFVNDPSLLNPPENTIPLSTLLNENGGNMCDIKFGRGAGITTSASYGGGGNRLYPNGGDGLVVVLY